jgi:hypothetical protein
MLRIGIEMSWVRSNLRFGSWCALFALTIQLLVLFNHVHCAQSACWPASQPAVGGVGGGTADASAESKPATPAAGEYCLLCAVIHLAGNALPAAPPAQRLPAAIDLRRPWTDLSVVLAATPHRIFQARAPPLA